MRRAVALTASAITAPVAAVAGMLTLRPVLHALALRHVRRAHPELFDSTLAVAQVNATIDQLAAETESYQASLEHVRAAGTASRLRRADGLRAARGPGPGACRDGTSVARPHLPAARGVMHGVEHISREQRRSKLLLSAGIVRIIGWTILGVCLGLGLLHVDGFTWAKALATSVPFVALISIYANWATDLDAATAAYAALVAANAHHDAESAHRTLTDDRPEDQ